MSLKTALLVLIASLFFNSIYAQSIAVDHAKIKEDLESMLTDLSDSYIYLEDKKVDLACIRNYYSQQISRITTEEETVLFFEYLLDEFYDNHLTLRTNRPSSYRLFAPIYAKEEKGKIIITNVWQSQLESVPKEELIGAEILTFNGISFNDMIDNFPVHCCDKRNTEVREWIINKILSGRYNEPRMISLKVEGQAPFNFDLDAVVLKRTEALLSSKTIDDIGIIRINNSLGNDKLVGEFDAALDELLSTKGLIIDLRNTIFGGDTYEARGIMGRFVDRSSPYQKHAYWAKSPNNPDVERSWVELVSPRLRQYKAPVVILVGRWTGSMGEGLAIGFEGMGRAEVLGTEMRRLAGEVYDFGFKHQNYGFKLSTAKLYHINGTIREKYVPTHYIQQTTIHKDTALEEAIKLVEMKLN